MNQASEPNKKPIRGRSRLRLATTRLKTFLWTATLDTPTEGFCFVADFSELGVGIYLGKKLAVDAPVRISFGAEDSVAYKAKVEWCQRFSMEQKFIGHKSLAYRLGLRFRFSSEAERQRYISYLDELKQKAIFIKPGMKF